jgi:hypothetical protein
MRAFEITIFIILIMTAPSLLQGMGVIPSDKMTCTGTACEVQTKLYTFASSFQLLEVDGVSPADFLIDITVLTITFPIYAMLWLLYFLSLIVLIKPALVSLFGVPDVLATYLNVGVVILWMAAYIQWKRGGLGLDASR